MDPKSASFKDQFIDSFKKSQVGKAGLKTKTYISPAKLAERRFYWEAELEDGTVEIDVPLPKLVISDVYSFLFLGAFQLLFEEEVIDDLPSTGDVEADAELALVKEAKKIWAKKQGLIFIEYMFYILWHQDDDEVREIINRCSQDGEWNEMFDVLNYTKVHSYVVDSLSVLGLEHVDALTNLVPFALDLYLYINTFKKPRTKKIDDESVKERADDLARYL